MKQTKEEYYENIFSNAMLQLYGYKMLCSGICVWALCTMISYITTNTLSSLIFWWSGTLIFALLAYITVLFSPNSEKNWIGLSFQKKTIHEVIRRNNLLLPIHIEILKNGKNEVITHGLTSYMTALKHRYPDFFKISDKSKKMVYPANPMHYANYWFTIEHYLRTLDELRKNINNLGMTNDATMEEIYAFVIKKNTKLENDDWLELGNIAISKILLEKNEKEIREKITEGEKLKKILLEKIKVFSIDEPIIS